MILLSHDDGDDDYLLNGIQTPLIWTLRAWSSGRLSKDITQVSVLTQLYSCVDIAPFSLRAMGYRGIRRKLNQVLI